MRVEIFGRTAEKVKNHGARGCGYIGKIVSYPGGRYEEIGEVHVDLTEPHCMLVLGKRGTGKSYTLGVLLEGFSLLEPEVRNRLAIVVVDTMSVFHSLKTANNEPWECNRMKDFKDLCPRPLDNVKIALPKLAEERMMSRGVQPFKDVELTMRPWEISHDSWMSLFGLKPTDAHGSLLLDVLSRVEEKEREWGLGDIRRELADAEGALEEKRGLLSLLDMVEASKIFSSSKGSLVEPGVITVLDISYMGRFGGLDLRAFLVSHIAKMLLKERTLQTTMEMQSQAGLVSPAQSSDFPLVWLVIDEAHLFLPSGGTCLSTGALIDWIKLGRHPGLSIVLATQEPSALHDTAIRQADLVISHQITAEPDVAALAKARQSFMTKDRDLASLVSMMDSRRGLAIVFDDKTRKMEYCMIRPRVTLHTGMDASALG